MIKVNSRNTRARCEICSKLTIKTPDYKKNNQKSKRSDSKMIMRFAENSIWP